MGRLKRWIIVVAGILVALILIVLLVGAMLPEQHNVSHTLQTKQSPQAIWDAISDHANEPKWRSDVASAQSQARFVQ